MSKGSWWSLVLGSLVAGCHGDSGQPSVIHITPKAAPASAAAKHGPTPQEMTAGMVEAVTVGKSSVPVDMKFDLSRRPMVGQVLEVVIAVVPQAPATAAVIQVSTPDGLPAAANAHSIAIGALDPTQAYRVTIPVTPTAEGMYLMTLTVNMTVDDVPASRSFSIPIIVDPATADTAAH